MVNILLHVLEDEVEVVVDANDFFEFDDLAVIQFAERLYFSEGHALLPRVKLLLHFLDCNLLFRLDVYSFDDRPVSAIA